MGKYHGLELQQVWLKPFTLNKSTLIEQGTCNEQVIGSEREWRSKPLKSRSLDGQRRMTAGSASISPVGMLYWALYRTVHVDCILLRISVRSELNSTGAAS